MTQKRDVPKLNKDNFPTWKPLIRLHISNISNVSINFMGNKYVKVKTTPLIADQLKKKKEQAKKQIELEIPSTQRKSTRIGKKKHVQIPSPKKRVNETTSGPGKRRIILQISSSKLEEETSDRLVEQAVQEVKTLIGRRAWKPNVENLNMQIINDNNFV